MHLFINIIYLFIEIHKILIFLWCVVLVAADDDDDADDDYYDDV